MRVNVVTVSGGIMHKPKASKFWLQIKLDAAVAWSQQQLQERDAEINRLQRELKV